MDVAAVLGSLYPGMTVILAWLVLKEKITRLSWPASWQPWPQRSC